MPPSRTSHPVDQQPDDDEPSHPFHHRLRTRNERDRSATIKREPPPDKNLQRRPARLMEVVITRSSTPLLGYIKTEPEVVRQSSLAAGALAAARSVTDHFVDEVLQSMEDARRPLDAGVEPEPEIVKQDDSRPTPGPELEVNVEEDIKPAWIKEEDLENIPDAQLRFLSRRTQDLPVLDFEVPAGALDNATSIFNRPHIAKHLGGSNQRMYCSVAPQHRGHRLFDLTLLLHYKCKFCPYAPERPGQHGALFIGGIGSWNTGRESWESQLVQTDVGVPVFRSEASSQWRYMGDYRFALAADATGEEWSEMDDKTRAAWYDPFSKLKGPQWDGWRRSIEQAAGDDSSAGVAPTFKAFDTAMGSEVESLQCYTMQCIGYREELLDDLNAPLPA